MGPAQLLSDRVILVIPSPTFHRFCLYLPSFLPVQDQIRVSGSPNPRFLSQWRRWGRHLGFASTRCWQRMSSGLFWGSWRATRTRMRSGWFARDGYICRIQSGRSCAPGRGLTCFSRWQWDFRGWLSSICRSLFLDPSTPASPTPISRLLLMASVVYVCLSCSSVKVMFFF